MYISYIGKILGKFGNGIDIILFVILQINNYIYILLIVSSREKNVSICTCGKKINSSLRKIAVMRGNHIELQFGASTIYKIDSCRLYHA